MSKDSFYDSFIEGLKDDDTSIAADGKSSAEFTGWIDTGCYGLNALSSGSLINGGIPNNKVVAFAGESGTGKTFVTLGIEKNFLQQNTDGYIIHYDTEAATTSDMMESRGIDSKRVLISEPITIEQFRTHALKVVNGYMALPAKDRKPLMMVLDSMGALSSNKEIADTSEGKDTRDMTKAQLLRATFRVLRLKLAKAKIPMIITCHTYAAVGAYVPTRVISGGDGLKYAADTIFSLTTKKDKDGTDVLGNIVTIEQTKGRLARRYAKVEARISFQHGLDKYYGLLALAEKHSIIKKVSTRYELPDGTKVWGKDINAEPEKYFTGEIMEKLELAAQKEYLYGVDEYDGRDESETELQAAVETE